MNRIWHNSFYPLLLVALLIPTAHASLDLLAGVEAGIETDTAMTTIDLDKTQEVLSSNDFEAEHSWINHHTGIQYQIQLLRSYSYGDDVQEKSLDACQHRSGKWISVSPSSMAF